VALVRRLLENPRLDRRQSHTLRSIVELCIQIVGVICILLVVFGIPRQLATMLGLVTSALTVALQDFLLAFLGWFVLIGRKGMRVGDMVEIDGVAGEVVEIGLFSTTLLETGSLEARGLPTGRRITLLNNFAIKGKYFNFSTSGQWMWDQFEIAVPASAQTHVIAEAIQAAAEEETAEDTRMAEQEWRRARAAGFSTMQAKPTVNLRPSGSDFKLEVRYVTKASRRFQARNQLYRRVVDVLQKPVAGSQL
jgi:small-conductance mechanosensitive channel